MLLSVVPWGHSDLSWLRRWAFVLLERAAVLLGQEFVKQKLSTSSETFEIL